MWAHGAESKKLLIRNEDVQVAHIEPMFTMLPLTC